MIAYASMYGNTEEAAECLASELVKKGLTNVVLYDVSSTHVSHLIAEAFKYSHIVLASVTYNMGMYPVMHNFLSDMKALNLQNRTFALIENGTWLAMQETLYRNLLQRSLKAVRLLKTDLKLCPQCSLTKPRSFLPCRLNNRFCKGIKDLGALPQTL